MSGQREEPSSCRKAAELLDQVAWSDVVLLDIIQHSGKNEQQVALHWYVFCGGSDFEVCYRLFSPSQCLR